MIWNQLPQFLVSGITSGSIYALIALGFGIIHNATGIVNAHICSISSGGPYCDGGGLAHGNRACAQSALE
jgi:hypothetical protein